MRIFRVNQNLEWVEIRHKRYFVIGFAGIFLMIGAWLNSLGNKPQIVETVVETQKQVFVKAYDKFEGTLLYDKIKSENRDAFVLDVKSKAKRLDIPYEDLMIMIYLESRLNYKARNPYKFQDGTYAVGLFQITPIARKQLGITYEQLLKMDEFEHLDLLYKYFKPFKGRINSFSDLYLANFMPSYLGKSDSKKFPNYVIEANKGLGVTIGQFRQVANARYNKILNDYK
jgi:hypothetical protein